LKPVIFWTIDPRVSECFATEDNKCLNGAHLGQSPNVISHKLAQ
jgi:hypothetical protein